jgi:general secretion pathway protein N
MMTPLTPKTSRLVLPLRRSASSTGPAPWAIAITGLFLGLLVAVVAFAPAAWLAIPMARATDGRVQLQEARGSVWNGSAQLFLTGGTGSLDRAALPGRLHWTLAPGLTTWQLNINADCCSTQPIVLNLSPGIRQFELAANDQQSQWPATLLSALGAPWNTIGLTADLSLQSNNLKLKWAQSRLSFDGKLVLKAMQASSKMTTLSPLGSYEVVVTGGATPRLSLSTLQGPLTLMGDGVWAGNKFRFEGAATASPETEAALNNLLNIIGRRQGARSIIKLG